MDYNTQRDKLKMPEYGRHIQKMVEYVASIPDKEKRNEQIGAVLEVMGILNPQLRDIADFNHKLWDHIHVISDFRIDIDSPYPVPTKETLYTRPERIPRPSDPIRMSCYGRNIQNMVKAIADQQDEEVRSAMISTIASYMKQQYLIWNKDSVSDETIFHDMERLSEGRLTIPEGMTISFSAQDQRKVSANSRNQSDRQNQKRKKWKKNGSL